MCRNDHDYFDIARTPDNCVISALFLTNRGARMHGCGAGIVE